MRLTIIMGRGDEPQVWARPRCENENKLDHDDEDCAICAGVEDQLVENVIAVRVRQEPGAAPEAHIEICPVDALAEVERASIKTHEDWPSPKLASEEELRVHFHGPEEPTGNGSLEESERGEA